MKKAIGTDNFANRLRVVVAVYAAGLAVNMITNGSRYVNAMGEANSGNYNAESRAEWIRYAGDKIGFRNMVPFVGWTDALGRVEIPERQTAPSQDQEETVE